MKIAVLSLYNLDSTAPLIKHLSKRNNDVDLFCMFTKNNPNGFVLNIKNLTKVGIYKLNSRNFEGEKIIDYFEGKEHNVAVFSPHKYKYLLQNTYICFKLSLILKRKKYDVIHFIGQTPFFFLLYRMCSSIPIVHSLHETLPHNNHESDSINYRFLNEVLNKAAGIIVHSKISYELLKEYNKSKISKVRIVKFGLYETYKLHESNNCTVKNSILYFGIIRPYKGIHILLKAFSGLTEKHKNLELVIAGRGNPYFNLDELNNKNITFINKELTEKEIVDLTLSSKIVVCPYTSASQSGIPMVAYLFNKPVIASNVGGFTEVIENNKTGILVEPENHLELARAIEKIMYDDNFYNSMVENIKTTYSNNEYNWDIIAEKTEKIYQDTIGAVKK